MPQSHYPFKSLKLFCYKTCTNRAFFQFPTKTRMKSFCSLCSSSSSSSFSLTTFPSLFPHPQLITSLSDESQKQQRGSSFTLKAAKSGGFSLNSITNRCKTCKGQGAIECPGCKGTGKNKKNGNIFERWKCFECQGFGLKSCPVCGKGGLTPEQRGER